MGIEEQVEQTAQQALQRAGEATVKGGARLTVKVSVGIVKTLLRIAGWPLKTTKETIKEKSNTGRMSVKKLQAKNGGDLHDIQLDPDSVREVTRQLKKNGIDYSITKEGDQYNLTFAGKDADHINHIVKTCLDRLGLTMTDDQPSLDDTRPEQEQAKTEPNQEEATPTAEQPAVQAAAEPEQPVTEEIPAIDPEQIIEPIGQPDDATPNPPSTDTPMPAEDVWANTEPMPDRDWLSTEAIPVPEQTFEPPTIAIPTSELKLQTLGYGVFRDPFASETQEHAIIVPGNDNGISPMVSVPAEWSNERQEAELTKAVETIEHARTEQHEHTVDHDETIQQNPDRNATKNPASDETTRNTLSEGAATETDPLEAPTDPMEQTTPAKPKQGKPRKKGMDDFKNLLDKKTKEILAKANGVAEPVKDIKKSR
ncbi:PcfB family protein [Bifidobacterium biavatii]|uniref:Mobilization protein n=1 Tax=Bifidobacterium biavatii DSM 23969 TaxID=1437608 RepID=A0A086ZHW3_9BIFI|nr:PcfB family protein [Bifidobacterium biavatii]KFI46113.1 mobilization protein [Bifidobacterium biavatii DSM 23969]